MEDIRSASGPSSRIAAATALLAAILAAGLSLGAAPAEDLVPSALARRAFRDDGGFSFRVEFAADRVTLKRTSYELPRRRRTRVMPAYLGESLAIFDVLPGPEGTKRTRLQQAAWEHQIATYQLPDDRSARVVLSRLSPAVLIDSPAATVSFVGGPGAGAAPRIVAYVEGGKVVVRRLDQPAPEAPAKLDLDEPWVLGWFGRATPHRGYRRPIDLDDPHDGAGFARADHPMDKLDLPILFRLEHKPAALEPSGPGLAFRFPGEAGKIAVMPPFGGRIFLPEETEKWTTGLPPEVLAQCRLWAEKLRDFPLSVTETYDVQPDQDVLAVRQAFRWLSFQDAWNSPPVKAAPLPPMLCLALGGGLPVTFHRDGRPVEPVDYRLMDTPGRAMGIEGGDVYEYRMTGLGKHLAPPAPAARPSPQTASLRAKLQRHVDRMIEAGPLAPLLFIHGGIGGARPGYFYWAAAPELARSLAMAWPHLPPETRSRARQYLRDEWKRNPPLEFEFDRYRAGAGRAPFDVPWDDIELAPAVNREHQIRRAHFFADLYGVNAYCELTGQAPGADLQMQIAQLAGALLTTQDWALCAPVRAHDQRVEFLTGAAYYERSGQAACNGWLAGAVGMNRLARKLRWDEGERLGHYLVGKLAAARVGQARYIAEMHRMGLIEGPPEEDWRTLIHVDRTAAILLRGNPKPGVLQDQELPPMIDLVEETGRLLGAHARPECKIYLDHLDRQLPLWYLSEAPKQSATEQRLCPLLYKNGNVLAQSWVLGKRGDDFRRYVDTTRFLGDLYTIQNLAAAIDSYRQP